VKKVLNIAHRGYTRRHPENTLEAFQDALELDVDGIEFDVQETADGRFFIFHNDDIDGRPILQLRSDEMQRKRIRGKFRIPTLEQALKLCGKGTGLIVELKQVRSLEKLLSMLRDYADTERMALVSFDAELVARMAELAPDIRRGVISDAPLERPSAVTHHTGSSAMGVRCQDLRPDLIAQLHEAGTMAFVWGCPDAASVRKALSFDIDGIISDYPEVVKEVQSAD